MAYTKTNWKNGQTPINEANLNKIENELEHLEDKKYALELGNLIALGTDLDDINTPGVYYSDNATRSASLSNTPVKDGGFKLIVENTSANNRYRQTIYCNKTGSDTYVRTFTAGNIWGSWYYAIKYSKVLFDGNSSDETITLSDSVNNYNFVEIYYTYNSKIYSQKLDVNKMKKASLCIINSTDSYLQPATAIAELNGNQLTNNGANGVNINLSTFEVRKWTGSISILKVIGYKD